MSGELVRSIQQRAWSLMLDGAHLARWDELCPKIQRIKNGASTYEDEFGPPDPHPREMFQKYLGRPWTEFEHRPFPSSDDPLDWGYRLHTQQRIVRKIERVRAARTPSVKEGESPESESAR